MLHWGAVVARDNAELAYQFTAHVRAAIPLMDLDGVEAWLLHAMELYDASAQRAAIRPSSIRGLRGQPAGDAGRRRAGGPYQRCRSAWSAG